MINKYMERSSSLIVREIEIKTSMGCHFSPTKIIITKRDKITSSLEYVKGFKVSYTVEMGNGTAVLKTVL